MSTIANPCTVCGKPGIPGLVAGAGKCQYHWNVGAYGQAWADEAQLKALHAHYREQRRGYGFTALPFDHWIQGPATASARWRTSRPPATCRASTSGRETSTRKG